MAAGTICAKSSVRSTAHFAWLNPESSNDVPGLKDEMSAWQVQFKDDSAILVARGARESIRYQLELLPEGPSKSKPAACYSSPGPI